MTRIAITMDLLHQYNTGVRVSFAVYHSRMKPGSTILNSNPSGHQNNCNI
jgi:hypothetical protein